MLINSSVGNVEGHSNFVSRKLAPTSHWPVLKCNQPLDNADTLTYCHKFSGRIFWTTSMKK